MKSSRSIQVPPRPTRPDDRPPAPPELYVEPESDIELLGEMLHDTRTMGEMLAQLPFDRAHYRANLRIVLGAAVRMRDRCQRLLEDGLQLPAGSGQSGAAAGDFLGFMAGTAIAESTAEGLELSAQSPLDDPETIAVVDSIIEEGAGLDDHAGQIETHQQALDPHRAKVAAAAAAIQGGNGKIKARRDGHEYTVVESFIMAELKERGTATTAELVDFVIKERRVPKKEAEDAMANLRITKRIVTSRLGKGILNRIAE